MASLRVKTSAGTETVVEETVIEELKEGLRGDLLRAGDENYESARRVFNAMIDKRPAMILQCAGTSDVTQAVMFAKEHGLLVAVRGGGHSVAGKAVCDGGILIDLSPMKGIHVDPKRRTARAQPGLRLGDFDRETQVHGLATTMGIATDTGMAGLTLGGGIGWLCGKYGLACDNLISAEVVTADGRVVAASAEENEDLFWGLRGGGGNFGIVTSFEYQLHAVGPVLGGVILYPADAAKEVLRFYDDFSRACPDELTTVGAMLNGPDGNLDAGIAVCYCGSLAEGEEVLKPLRSFGSPVADLVKPMSYVELQSILDWAFPPGRQHYWKSNFLQQLTQSAIETFVE
jgi:FAD/FMN-containing dehydrogenase